MEKDSNITKVALAYELIMQNNFGLKQSDLRKYRESIHDEMRDIIMGLRAIADDSFMEEDNAIDTKYTVESNIKDIFLKNINKFIQNSNYSKNFGLIYNKNKYLDLVNVISEYSTVLLKEYMIYGMERFILDVEIKDAINDAIIQKLNFKEYGNDIYKETIKALGLNGIRKISAFNLESKDGMTDGDIKFNVNIRDGIYYNKNLDNTYFIHDDKIIVVKGEYKTEEDLLNSNEAFKNALEDYDNMKMCIARNPAGNNGYKAANGMYYYRINNVYYKSEKEFSDDEIDNNFLNIRQDFVELKEIKDFNIDNVAQFGLAHNKDYITSIKNTCKANIKNILGAYKKGDRANLENKAYTLHSIKDSFKAYEAATKEEIENMKWFKFIRSYFKMKSVKSLKNDIVKTLRITSNSFDEVICENNAKESSLYAANGIKDALSSMSEVNVCGLKYLTNNIKKSASLEQYSNEDIKKMVSKNIVLDISAYDLENEESIDLDNNSFIKENDEINNLKDDISLEPQKEFFDPNISMIEESLDNDNNSMRLEVDELKNIANATSPSNEIKEGKDKSRTK